MDEALVINVIGRIDGVNASQFSTDLDANAESHEGPCVVLDLSELTYISSAGLRSLLMFAKTLKEHHKAFSLCALSDPIREIIETTGFHKLIDTHPTLTEALRHHQNFNLGR